MARLLRTASFRRALSSFAVLAALLLLAVRADAQTCTDRRRLPDNWQLQLDRLQVEIDEEGDDEPYLAVIGFKSTFGVRGSTRTFFAGALSELESPPGDAVQRGETASIPGAMGVIDFGPTDGCYENLTLVGAVVVAMESDATPFGTMADQFSDLEKGLRDLLRTEWETGTGSLLDPEERARAVARVKCSMEIGTWEGLAIWLSSWGDPDDLIATQSLLYLAGTQTQCDAGVDNCADPVLSGTRPWETGVTNIGEQTFDLATNAIRFDARVPPGAPPVLNCEGVPEPAQGQSVFYKVGGRLTSTVVRGGFLTAPPVSSSHWNQARLEFERCSGCQRAQTVFFHARYDAGDGQGVRDRVLGSATPDPAHPRKFYSDWWFAQAPPQDAEFFAEMVTPAGDHFFTEPRPIRLNREQTAPTGAITLPAADSHHRGVIRFEAQVTDAQSGVDRVEYYLTTAANTRIDVTPAGRTAPSYRVDWSPAAVPEGLVSVCAEAYDVQGNHRALACVTNVRIDRTAPTVGAILPAPINQPATWLTSNTAVLRATAADAGGGIREVRFTAWYRDAANVYGSHLLGTGTALPNGEYRYTWNLAAVPDQADLGRHQLYVDITAEDRAGNTSFDTGWLAGVDRAAPTVRITQPASIARVRGGTLAIAVTAGDNLGPAGAADRLLVVARYRDPNAASATDHTLANVGPASSWTGSLNLNPLADQILNITATATDAAGQRSTASSQVTLDRTAPTFTGVSITPQPFLSGGPRSMSFSYTASEPASVTIAVSDAAGAIVRKIATSVGTNPNVTPWDGRDDQGAFLPTGSYTYAISGTDPAGNVGTHPGAPLALVYDVAPPVVSVALAPNPYRLSGPALNIRYTQNEPCRTEVEVLSGSSVIRYLGALQSGAGTFNVTWNGLDAAGVRVPVPASYTIRVRSVDGAGLATIVTATIPVQQ